MVDFVGVLALLAFLLVRFVLQNLDAFSSACLVLACFSHRVQLTYLVLRETGGEGRHRPGMNAQTQVLASPRKGRECAGVSRQAPADVAQRLFKVIRVDYSDTHLFHRDWQHNATEGRDGREANEFKAKLLFQMPKARSAVQ